MSKRLMLLAAMVAMVLVAAAPAFGQTTTQTGGGVTANDSIVQLCQNFFGVTANVTQTVDQNQTVDQSGTASASVDGTGNATALQDNVAEQVANLTGVNVSDISQSCANTLNLLRWWK